MSRTKVTPHLFEASEDVPADPWTGDEWCGVCNHPGRPGDARHTLPDPPDDDVQLRAAGDN